jgi:hypothetical protein
MKIALNFTCALSESPMPEAVPPSMGAPEALRSNGWGCRVIGTANEE